MPSGAAKQRLETERLEMYRHVVLEAAERVFARQGFDGTRMREIAAEASISLSTLYEAFEGKAELFDAIHESRCDQLFERSGALLDREGTLDIFLTSIATTVGFMLEHRDFLRLHLRDGANWSGGPNPQLRGGNSRWQTGIAMQAEVFRRGVEEGIFIPDDPLRMARLTAAIYQMQLAEWLDGGGREDAELLIERIQAYLRRAFCRSD